MSSALLDFLLVSTISCLGTLSLWKVVTFLWDRYIPKKPSQYEVAHRPGPALKVIKGDKKE